MFKTFKSLDGFKSSLKMGIKTFNEIGGGWNMLAFSPTKKKLLVTVD